MRKGTIALFFVMLSISLSCPAQDQSNQKTEWDYTIAPYGWIFGINGSMTVKGTTIKIDTTPGDTLKLLKDVDFIGQLHMEANKGPWTILLDPTYLKLTQDGSMGPLAATVSPEIAFVDFGTFYTLANPRIAQTQKPLLIQVLGGGRYFHMRIKIRPSMLPSVSESQDFVTPIIGGRIKTQLDKRWNLLIRGDIGGFGIDDVKKTWSASAITEYSLNKKCMLALGFRVMGIDYAHGSGASRFAIDTRFWGPVFGIIFKA